MSQAHQTADYLAAYRTTMAVPPGRRTENMAAIHKRVAGEHDRPEPELSEPSIARPTPRAASFLFIAKSASISVLLGVVGLGTVKLGAMAFATPTAPAVIETNSEGSESSIGSKPSVVAPTRPSQPPSATIVAPATAPLEAPAIEKVAAPSPGRGSQPAPSASTGAPTRPDTLRAEVELMRRVAKAIERQEWVTALNLTAQHQKSFPSGAMTEERAAWQAVAKCNLGKSEGIGLANAFAAAYPRSSLVAKVRHACPAGGLKKRSTDSGLPPE